MNGIFVVLEKSGICNFADYSYYGSNLSLIPSNVEHDMNNLLELIVIFFNLL